MRRLMLLLLVAVVGWVVGCSEVPHEDRLCEDACSLPPCNDELVVPDELRADCKATCKDVNSESHDISSPCADLWSDLLECVASEECGAPVNFEVCASEAARVEAECPELWGEFRRRGGGGREKTR